MKRRPRFPPVKHRTVSQEVVEEWRAMNLGRFNCAGRYVLLRPFSAGDASPEVIAETLRRIGLRLRRGEPLIPQEGRR